ncbi:BolA family protein [Rhodomicrobium vannielii ATCC 17100]|jgi:BolA-like protein 1|uniref:BolA family protein n=1 Tax=Rhodomicrobium vannielii (strain ATCC 17100 / DSM 162 / LMG 4299 / NCIMB 10020 / ATH 3.1.1) TaxID=648757 RepID=E3I726_RHOVT|nr:BolA family protein [Rhodomicrobium vannielii]ADP69591.1 BolA family protein [Rhodomicrobium vannielii ATCC 17100]MBJ7532858.1 BolA family transcriptional regulator [Rhodomicrobium vannielii ATCC 17100]
MSVEKSIREKLEKAFLPTVLAIENESGKHAHHVEQQGRAGPSGDTHFRVRIVSSAFEGKSSLERHRAVNAALAEELAGPVHALAIKALTPAETA